MQTAEGKLFLFVGIDRTSKFAVTQLVDKADRKTAWEFLQHMLEAFAGMRLILSGPYHSHRQRHSVRRAAAKSQHHLFPAHAL